jgi:uncharacterized protein YfiM (DUF2279 family)
VGFAQKRDATIPQDKQLHYISGLLTSAVAYTFSYGLQNKYTTNKKKHNKALIIAAGAALGIGLVKELYDSRKGGSGFDIKDLGATVLGGMTLGVTYKF